MRDRDVRRVVLERLASEHAGDQHTRVVEEMEVWSGTVRVDIAVINGELGGYELKSDRDTLERLPLQADIYSRVFDRVTLVVGTKHAAKARKIIPKWWGVIIATYTAGEVKLTDYRSAKPNPRREALVLVDFLNKNEALQILEQFGLAKGWRSRRATEIAARLAAELPAQTLADAVRSALKAREYLGQGSPRSFKMPVGAESDPMSESAGLGSARGDLVDLAVSPALPERRTRRIARNITRVC